MKIIVKLLLEQTRRARFRLSLVTGKSSSISSSLTSSLVFTLIIAILSLFTPQAMITADTAIPHTHVAMPVPKHQLNQQPNIVRHAWCTRVIIVIFFLAWWG